MQFGDLSFGKQLSNETLAPDGSRCACISSGRQVLFPTAMAGAGALAALLQLSPLP